MGIERRGRASRGPSSDMIEIELLGVFGMGSWEDGIQTLFKPAVSGTWKFAMT
jgi:hypothetical protein